MLVAPTAEHTGNGGPNDPDKDARARQHLQDIQRTRIIDAATAVAAELGVHDTTVAHIVDRAGISRRTFYELFENGRECVLEAIGDAAARATRRVTEGRAEDELWQLRVRAGLLELLRFFDEDRAAARLLVIDSLGAGAESLAIRERLKSRVVAELDRVREENRAARQAPALAGEGALGAVSSVLQTRLLQERQAPAAELLNQLMSMIVLPYLGAAAARQELQRPVAAIHSNPSEPAGPALDMPGLRLTLRTVQVLDAIAASPGSSNRAVGSRAGMSDQGQISRLLSRLQRLGLIENDPESGGRGEPNAWMLTSRGSRFHQSLRA